MNDEPGLPPLETECDCVASEQTLEFKSSHALQVKARNAWEDKESTAYLGWSKEHPFSSHEQWTASDAYHELGAPPEVDPVGIGCVECDFTRRRLTPAGKQIAAFVMQLIGPRLTTVETKLGRVGV